MTDIAKLPASRFPSMRGFSFRDRCGPRLSAKQTDSKRSRLDWVGMEPNPDVEDYGSGYRSEHALVSQLFDCAFIILACFPSPSGERISLILWLRPRSSRRDDLRPPHTTFWKHRDGLLLGTVNPLPGNG